MSHRLQQLRREFPPYLRGGSPASCAAPAAQAARSPARPPMAGEHLFELRLTDADAALLRDAMRVSTLDAAGAIVAALRFWSAETLGQLTGEGDLTSLENRHPRNSLAVRPASNAAEAGPGHANCDAMRLQGAGVLA